MSTHDLDKAFSGSIPEVYEKHLVPLIFAPYADDLVSRLRSRSLSRVLEVAAGTGVLTRSLASTLPQSVSIIATDLNPSMLEVAANAGTSRHVDWRPADVMDLPFDDESADAVICQFGAMFFPSKPAAFAQMRRVLRPGGVLIFNVWDRIEANEFADVVTTALEDVFPDNPPRFLARTPHGYCDRALIERDLAQAGFATPAKIDVVSARSRAASCDIPAIAYCQGTPLRNEIETRDGSRLVGATDAAASAIAARFGRGPVDGMIRAYVVTVER